VRLEGIFQINKIIDTALEEDIGNGDITTTAIIDSAAKGQARLIAKEEMLLAGIEIFTKVFTRIDPEITVKCVYHDGDIVPSSYDIGIIYSCFRHFFKHKILSITDSVT
jgi:nicotinate-nucleotide pyrophosphorylase (carboxylating)